MKQAREWPVVGHSLLLIDWLIYPSLPLPDAFQQWHPPVPVRRFHRGGLPIKDRGYNRFRKPPFKGRRPLGYCGINDRQEKCLPTVRIKSAWYTFAVDSETKFLSAAPAME